MPESNDPIQRAGITYRTGPIAGDSYTAARLSREFYEAEAKADHRFVVAPRCNVTLRGAVYTAGQPVDPISGIEIAGMMELAHRGVVYHLADDQILSRTRRPGVRSHVVRLCESDSRSLMAPSGASFTDGEPIGAADLIDPHDAHKRDPSGALTLQSLIDRGLVVSSKRA